MLPWFKNDRKHEHSMILDIEFALVYIIFLTYANKI